jgi:HAD superfamily hydrolase (TIGR01450 family)
LLLAGEVVAGASEAVAEVRATGRQALYLTNASGRTRGEIGDALVGIGIPAALDAVYSSAAVTARWLGAQSVECVWVLGTLALGAELAAAGMRVVRDEGEADAVVVGLDRRQAVGDEPRLLPAALAVRVARRECMLVGCNRDLTYPGPSGVAKPGCGRVLALVETQCGRSADAVVGKPEPFMLEWAAADHRLAPREILVVGDSWTSDIGMARRCGCAWAYVPAPGAGVKLPTPPDASEDPLGRVLASVEQVPAILGRAPAAWTR